MVNPWEHFSAEQIAEASRCPLDAVTMYWPKIVEQLDHCGINDRATQVAAIGTIAIETASTFRPIHEYGTPADWAGYSGGARYAGRGFIQLTHDYNYAAYGQAVDELWHAGGGIDLVARPDDALDPDVAAAVLACYFRDHTTAQGYSIPEAANAGDWTWVRRLVQGGTAGLDRLVAVAGALTAAEAPEPEPTPSPEPSTLYAVTPGILAKMAEMGDEPATNEYYPVADWSETFGRSGRRYVYVASTNTVYVYAPAA